MGRKRQDNDALIEECAMNEFLEHGYRDASMRRIADAAGVTTGSIYARYKSKEELFLKLTAPVVQDAGKAFEILRPIYYAARTAEDMGKAMRKEEEVTLHVIFDHYEAATLLLCRSEGSTAESFFRELTQQKITETEKFFSGIPDSKDLRHAVEVILTMQFDMYRQILQNGYSLQEAESCMKILSGFINGGWQTMMSELLSER